ncbi:YncE family protein, partial [Pseudomonas synxantha]
IKPTLSRLNPAHVLQSGVVTVRVRYRPMLPSDDIKVHIIGKPGLGTPDIGIKPGIPAPGGDYVDFTVPNVFVGANLAQSCRVFFEVIRDHKREPSRELTLEIEALEAQYWDLVSVPQAEANSGVIDVTKAHDVRIDAWPFLRYDPENPQAVWIDAEGTVNQVLRNGTPLTPAEFAAERILTPIPASYLRRLADGSPLDLKAYVSLDGGGRATAQPLVPASYRIRKQPGVVDSINVGGGPDRIVINAEGTVAYVANYNSATVSVIDLTTFSLSDTIVMPANTYTNGLALHPDGSRLYVSGYHSSEIQVIDTSDNTISNKITGIHVYGYGGFAFNLDGSRLYYGAYYQARLQVIDTSNDTLIYTGYAYYPVDLALAPQGTRLYCAGLGAMGIIDTATNTQLSTLAGFSYAWRLAYSPYAQKIYVTDQSAANVKIVDARTNLISNTIPNLTGAFGIAFHPTRRLAYVTMRTSNSVAIIDIDKEEVIRTMTGFVYPTSIAIAPDGSYALVSNYNANTVFIVQL